MRRLVSATLSAVLTAGCANHDEVARAPSPDGRTDAVLVEGNGGATTSFWYDVYVVKSGAGFSWAEPAANLYGAVRSGSAYGANLRWEGSETLVVEFLRARDVKHLAQTIRVGERNIRIVLRDGVLDPKAPPGGMLYNLKRRPHYRS